MKITTHLDHISHCKITLVIVWYKLVESMDPPSILPKHSPRFNRLSRVRIVQLSRSWVDCHTFLGLTCWVSGKHLSSLARGRARARQIDQIHFFILARRTEVLRVYGSSFKVGAYGLGLRVQGALGSLSEPVELLDLLELRFRANSTHIRQSRPDSGVDMRHYQCESLQHL